MFIGLSKLTLENELNDLMVKLPAAVGEDLWRWGDTKPLHICIGKVVRELGIPVVRLVQALCASTVPLEDMPDGTLQTLMV